MPTTNKGKELDKFLIRKEQLLRKLVTAGEKRLFDMVAKELFSRIKTTNGIVTNTGANLSAVKALDKVFEQFVKNTHAKITKQFVSDLQQIVVQNTNYFKEVNDGKALRALQKKATETINKRLGIKPDGTPMKGGFVDKFLKDKSLREDLKKLTQKNIRKGQTWQQFKESIKTNIIGDQAKGKLGGLNKYYRQFAYDTYSQVDRQAQKIFADGLQMNYFIYQGGLIASSRAFCMKRNGKVFSRDEAKQWSKLVGKENGPVVAEDADYDPLIDMGGINCRHQPRWITDSTAKNLR